MLDRSRATTLASLMERPQANALDVGYWDAISQRRLTIQTCAACSHHQHPPFPYCEACGGEDFLWAPLSGDGEVFSLTVVHHPPRAELAGLVPYVIALISLDGASDRRMLANIITEDGDDTITVGDRVRVTWLELPDGTVLPAFAKLGNDERRDG